MIRFDPKPMTRLGGLTLALGLLLLSCLWPYQAEAAKAKLMPLFYLFDQQDHSGSLFFTIRNGQSRPLGFGVVVRLEAETDRQEYEAEIPRIEAFEERYFKIRINKDFLEGNDYLILSAKLFNQDFAGVAETTGEFFLDLRRTKQQIQMNGDEPRQWLTALSQPVDLARYAAALIDHLLINASLPETILDQPNEAFFDVWHFLKATVETQALRLIKVSPLPGQALVSVDAKIKLKFDHKLSSFRNAVSRLSLMELTRQGPMRVDADIKARGNRLELTPKKPLLKGHHYEVVVHPGIEGTEGTRLFKRIGWVFTIENP